MADRRSAPSDDTAEASETSAPDGTQGTPDESTDDSGRSSDAETRPTGLDADSDDRSDAADDDAGADNGDSADAELAALRQAVEDKYDFEDFGPEDMAEMSYEEWEAVFDADSWITGSELLDRVEADLRNRVAARDVFARIERLAPDPEEREPARLLAYSDEGYALVYPDGSVDGRGTVLRDVTPTVALCSMDDYEIEDPPDGELLPNPSEVSEGSGELGNFMLQIVAAVQLLAGVGLLVAVFAGNLGEAAIIAVVGAVVFLLAGVFLFFVVANARLSDRFRAEEYRGRLRAIGLESGDRPDFLPIDSGDAEDDSDSAT